MRNIIMSQWMTRLQQHMHSSFMHHMTIAPPTPPPFCFDDLAIHGCGNEAARCATIRHLGSHGLQFWICRRALGSLRRMQPMHY
mmetsp:Transcript_40569/g.60139  ORF Transcript_40569/g.60139 Transcript_40569/m.60139 type:complete len:84 (-) Transcript_40569:259-510(-)